ncbi:MAG: phosphopantetheine-binding protein [Gemmatimonadota bacterium]
MHPDDEILSILLDHLGRLAPEGVTVTPETDLVARLGLDSTTLIHLLLDLEDELDVAVPLNAMADVRTPADFAEVIRHLREKD